MLVSVVTPALNGMAFLADCVESVKRQSVPGLVEVEHIVVDGGSTDGTAEFAAASGCVVMGRERPSVTYAINKGVAHARGELIGMLGCDDRLLDGAIADVVATHRRGGRRWVTGACRYLNAAGHPRGDHPAPPSWLSTPMLASLGWNCITYVSTYIHRDVYAEFGGLDESFGILADHDFFCRVLAAEPFWRMRTTVAASIRHGANLSMSFTPQQLQELALISKRYGPESPTLRLAYRYLLKLWINGANPAWFARKKLDRLRERPAG